LRFSRARLGCWDERWEQSAHTHLLCDFLRNSNIYSDIHTHHGAHCDGAHTLGNNRRFLLAYAGMWRMMVMLLSRYGHDRHEPDRTAHTTRASLDRRAVAHLRKEPRMNTQAFVDSIMQSIAEDPMDICPYCGQQLDALGICPNTKVTDAVRGLCFCGGPSQSHPDSCSCQRCDFTKLFTN